MSQDVALHDSRLGGQRAVRRSG